mmetsp:Transcript_124227/g.397626  ORF Transcript_124227/g.397626 Transcript_124227/m.397626 type:complete len:213 (-) Transcript_124227:1482-2120(-)
MPHHAGINQQGVPGLGEAVRDEQAAAKGDERVAAPIPHKTRSEVRQPGGQRGHLAPTFLKRPVPMQRRARRRGPELSRRHGEVPDQGATAAAARDKGAGALDHSAASRCAELGDRVVEVEGHKVSRKLRDDCLHARQPSPDALQGGQVLEALDEVAEKPIAFTDVPNDRADRQVDLGATLQVERRADTHETTVYECAEVGDLICPTRTARSV